MEKTGSKTRKNTLIKAATTLGITGAALVATLAQPAQALAATATAKAKVKLGSVVDTPFGPVQVKVKAKGTKILSATAVQFPNMDRRSAQINAYAIPKLQQQAVAAQSAQIDGVSGASWSSMGFAKSLQSALTALGIK